MQQLQQVSDLTNVKISGYKLTTALLRGGLRELNLSTSAGLVLLYLASCYNGKPVFPHLQTIADNCNMSLSSVQRAIKELLTNQIIIKSKRSKKTGNNNLYAFTSRIFNLTGKTGQNEQFQTGQFDQFHEHEKSDNSKLEQQHAGVVSFNKKFKGVEEQINGTSSTTYTYPICSNAQFNLQEPPQILKDKAERGEIRNLHAYWNSLREAHKIDYWKQQQEADKEAEKKEAYKKWQEEQEQIREREEKELEAFRNKPLNEQFSRETALSMVRLATRGGRSIEPTSLTAQLIKLYQIDIKSMV